MPKWDKAHMMPITAQSLVPDSTRTLANMLRLSVPRVVGPCRIRIVYTAACCH